MPTTHATEADTPRMSGRSTTRDRALRARERTFLAHSTLIVAEMMLIPLVFSGALLEGSPLLAVNVLLIGWVATAVIAIAWMRPAGVSPEHHPKIDKLFDDTSP